MFYILRIQFSVMSCTNRNRLISTPGGLGSLNLHF